MTINKTGIQKIWLTVALSFVLVMGIVFGAFVDLKPQISPDFFFGSDDPEMADTRKIAEQFPAEEFIILNIAGDKILGAAYLKSLNAFTEKLKDLNAFNRVLSLTQGPASPAAANDSPFWRPLLIEENSKATFVLAFLPRTGSAGLIAAVEEFAADFENKAGFGAISISGMPYIAEHIKRSIVRDAQIFSAATLLIFAAVLFLIYRSWVLTLGAAISGLGAICASLAILNLLGQPIGILTANLAIIIFVLVQSQVIYLTNNWQRQSGDPLVRVFSALCKTGTPAFWCAATTLLGFTSLLFVSAEPLRQLGLGGAVGVVMALVFSFAVFPAFLSYASAKPQTQIQPQTQTEPQNASTANPDKASKYKFRGALTLLTVCLVLGISPGLFSLNTDPGLFSYFEPDSDIGKGLRTIDQNGGSSPLQLVVRLKTGDNLDTADAYEQLWALHQSLADHPSVGTVLSLPALLAEANNHPLAFLLPWREIVSLLRLESNQQAADSFLSADRESALFLLRMKEQTTETSRLDIIADLQKRTDAAGFNAELVGGVYALQTRLSALVSESIVLGVISLLSVFLLIALLVTRDVRLGVAAALAAATIPLIILGVNGQFNIPMDIISAPAISVSLGLAVDALIHLGMAVRRKLRDHTFTDSWQLALREQSAGIYVGGGIIALGFSIFAISEFPPTVRFGGVVTAGSLMAMIASLALFPTFSRLLDKFRPK